jgi:hypothetical protein
MARQVGRGYRELKRMQTHLKAELRDVVSEFDSEETGIPTPAATGDPVPMLPPIDTAAASVPSTSAEAASEMSLPPAAVALPPSEVALPPAEVALPPADPSAEPS